MNWSFQLYSARNADQRWEKILEMVAGAGYSAVEGFGSVYDDPAGFRRALDRNGLSMPTGHFALDHLEKDFDGACRTAEALDVRIIICPYLMPEQRPADAAGWRAFGERLATIGEKAKAAGYGFAWHNHDFEFRTLADGAVPLEIILDAAPGIGWEIDVAWVIRGGADPLRWIGRDGKRIVAVHVKDIAPAGQNADEDGWADVGRGTVDWKTIMKALTGKTPARVFVMEHDKPSDAARFARRSIEAANRF